MKKRFLALYDEYYPKLYAYVLVRVRQRELAEDIVQQTFLKALDHIDSFKPHRGATFGSWLFKIAKHELIDRSRKDDKVTFCETEILDSVESTSCTISELILEEVQDDQNKTWQQVLQAIDQLNDLEREIITLKYLAGMSYKDISALTGKKPNTLAVSLKRSLQKIRMHIGYETA